MDYLPARLPIKLDRRLITGNITINTPCCVLEEICESMGLEIDISQLEDVQYRNLLSSELDKSVETITDLSSVDNMSLCAFYINPRDDLQWNRRNLFEALEWLTREKFDDCQTIDLIKNPLYIFDNPTPEDTRKVNKCILYNICMNMKIPTYYDSTPQKMRMSIVANNLSTKATIDDLILRMERCEQSILDKMYMILHMAEKNKDVWVSDKENLEDTTHFLRSKFRKIKGLIPRNNSQAVCIMAAEKSIDLSYSIDPIADFDYYNRTGKFLTEKMSMLHRINGQPPMLNMYFNQNIPKFYYTAKILETLRIRYCRPEVDDVYLELTAAMYINMFYYGVHPRSTRTKTRLNMYDVYNEKDCKDQVFLTTGSISSKYEIYTVSELEEIFTRYELLVNVKKEPLTDLEIQTLKVICIVVINPQLQKLRETIEKVELLCSMKEKRVKSFHDKYMKSDEKTKKKIEKVLDVLRNIAFILRGWEKEGPYPIINAPHPDEDKSARISYLATQEIRLFEKKCKKLGKMGTLFTSLPIYDYKDLKLVPVTEKEVGRTIAEKINLIKEGENSENENTCIRMSSNHICYTIHHYMSMIGKDPMFLLHDVSPIT